MWRRFEQHLHSLPDEQRPGNEPLKAIAFVDWKNSQESELNGWKEELANLEGQPIDGQLVFNNARDRLLRLFEAEAREAGMLPQRRIRETFIRTPVEERSLKGRLEEKSNSSSPTDSASRTRPSRLAKGQRIPQREFIKPILEALVELGGSARGASVLESVEKKVESKFSEDDLKPLSSNPRELRWHNRAQWCRNALVSKHGFLRDDSPRGVWEITDSGRQYLDDLNQETPLQAPVEERSSPDSSDTGEWMTFVQLAEWSKEEPSKGASIKPQRLQYPSENEISVSNWADLLCENG